MCGIAVTISKNHGNGSEFDYQILKLLQNRGPDATNSVQRSMMASAETSLSLNFIAAVLHIQGDIIGSQPIVYDDCILCWNGEVFGGLEINHRECDTVQVMRLLCDCVLDSTDIDNKIVNSLSRIWGPYAFIFYDVKNKNVFYGRDPFGRRSLLTEFEPDNIMISSVSSSNNAYLTNNLGEEDEEMDSMQSTDWIEVDTNGIYKISLQSDSFETTLIPWPNHRIKLARPLSNGSIIKNCDRNLLADTFLEKICSAMSRRLNSMHNLFDFDSDMCQCNVGVLFSGGIDSVLLAAVLGMCCQKYMREISCDKRISINLMNVSFYDDENVTINSIEKSPSPDRLASIIATLELKQLFTDINWNLVHVDIGSTERRSQESHIKKLIYPCKTHMDLNIGTAFWFVSRGLGYTRDYGDAECNKLLDITYEGTSRPLLRVGELGAASSVGVKKRNKEEKTEKIRCDRHNSHDCKFWSKSECLYKLCKRCCLEKQASSNEKALCKAHKRKQMEEISSGASIIDNFDETSESIVTQNFASQCKCYIVGIGADEQLAGYGRHRTTFQRLGIGALEAELNMDMQRLWKRNLGRDDRCISDNGVESWYPFLDEEVVGFLQNLHINEVFVINNDVLLNIISL